MATSRSATSAEVHRADIANLQSLSVGATLLRQAVAENRSPRRRRSRPASILFGNSRGRFCRLPVGTEAGHYVPSKYHRRTLNLLFTFLELEACGTGTGL